MIYHITINMTEEQIFIQWLHAHYENTTFLLRKLTMVTRILDNKDNIAVR